MNGLFRTFFAAAAAALCALAIARLDVCATLIKAARRMDTRARP